MNNFDRVENAQRDDRQQLIADLEPEYKCPVSWADGPVRNAYRKVTDKFCLVLFVLYLLAMIGTGIYAYVNSDPRGINKVYDSSGNICGEYDAAEYPLLYMQTFTAPYKSVCVKECPTFDYNQIKYNSTGVSTYSEGSEIPELDFRAFNSKYGGLSHTTSKDIKEHEAFDYNEGWANGQFTRDQWNNYLKSYDIECLHNNEFKSCKFGENNFFIYDSYPVSGIFCSPLSPKAGLMFNRVSSKFDNGDIGDMLFALPLFGWVALSALGMSLVFLIVITCCTRVITWFLIFALGVLFIAFGGVIIANYVYTGPLNDSWNALRVKYLEYFIVHKPQLLTLAAFMILFGFITFIIMCKHRKSINIAIPIITIASRSTLKNSLLIFLSIFIMAAQLFVFFIEAYLILKMYAMGVEKRDIDAGSPFVTYETNTEINALIALHIFGAYWLVVVLNNFNDFVCAAIGVNYYWGSQIENIRIFCHSLGHNIGSVAWSILLLPIMLVKIVFGWIDWLTSSDHPNALQRGIRKILCPCCWFYERFIDVISESYFAITYLGSENFWPANKRYYFLSEKYYDQSSTISFVGGLFATVAKLLIVISTVAIGYSIYKESIKYQQNIDNIGLLFFLFAFVGFFVGSLFVNLFATTYDSMLTCYLVELNIQDTSGRAITKCPEELREVMKELKQQKDAGYNRLA
jgi:hypothetical protein